MGPIRKDSKFVWSQKCQNAYEILKRDITSEQVLIYFDPNLPKVLTTDASNHAVAGILLHRLSDGSVQTISYVSRALSKSELHYSTLEKEALAIIFSITKLKQYFLGNKFILQTGHKPLISIFGEKKGLPILASACMQRWAFFLSGFNYIVEHIKGISNKADHLSRVPQAEISDDYQESSYIQYVEDYNVLNLSFKDIAKVTRRDPILSKVADAISNGKISYLKGYEFAPYKDKCSVLYVEQDCILWGYRTFVPSKFRMQILTQLHQSHYGIVKTKSIA